MHVRAGILRAAILNAFCTPGAPCMTSASWYCAPRKGSVERRRARAVHHLGQTMRTGSACLGPVREGGCACRIPTRKSSLRRREMCAVAIFVVTRLILAAGYGRIRVPARSGYGHPGSDRHITGTLSGVRAWLFLCRQAAGSGGAVERRARGQPVSRYGTAPTRERMRSGRPARAWASAIAIITASARPRRVFIFARPRM